MMHWPPGEYDTLGVQGMQAIMRMEEHRFNTDKRGHVTHDGCF